LQEKPVRSPSPQTAGFTIPLSIFSYSFNILSINNKYILLQLPEMANIVIEIKEKYAIMKGEKCGRKSAELRKD
jgi:hypothetical protein